MGSGLLCKKQSQKSTLAFLISQAAWVTPFLTEAQTQPAPKTIVITTLCPLGTPALPLIPATACTAFALCYLNS